MALPCGRKFCRFAPAFHSCTARLQGSIMNNTYIALHKSGVGCLVWIPLARSLLCLTACLNSDMPVDLCSERVR
jgi:hypothetical protein